MVKQVSRLEYLSNGGVSNADYTKIIGSVHRKNEELLRKTSCIATVILLFLFLSSFFIDSIAKNRILYGSFFLIMLLVYLFNKFIIQNQRYITILFYLFLLFAYLFGIILGAFLQIDIPATTFCVLLFALPLLIIDKPWRVSLLLILVSTIFCICVQVVKPTQVASLDCVNTVSFLFLGIIVNYFVMRTKINEIISREHIKKERDTDDLTKLLSKAAASREINMYMQNKKGVAALLVIDIDNFKQINDKMGHAYGDAVLRVMGDCIKKVFRSTDVLSRFGGDEFVIFLVNVDQKHLVEQRVEALVDEMNSQLKMTKDMVVITGSIGIAFFPQDANNYDELFQKADMALYQSKEKGKNCYSFYLDLNLVENNILSFENI